MSSSPFLDHLKRVATKLENDFPGTDCGIVASAYLGTSEAFDLVNREIVRMEDDHAAALAAKDERIKELEGATQAARALMQRWFASTVKSRMPYIQLLRADTADWFSDNPQPAAREGGECE